MVEFDEAYWLKVITKPDWYKEFVKFYRQAETAFTEGSEELNKFRYAYRHFFEKVLKEKQVALASTGPDLDEQREPVDTVVIHHTSNNPGYRITYLNAVHLLNIYAPYYSAPTDERERSLKGQPIWSGHFKDGQQVFYAYHWLIRMNGSFERLLDDNQIGWHAGDWEINKRSVAICLDNDYENQDPEDGILRQLALHVREHYPQVSKARTIGHREARKGTICPGTNFLATWKAELLRYI